MNKKSVIGWIVIPAVIILLGGMNACSKKDEPVETQKPFTRLVENQYIQSRILCRQIHYAVLLPEDYEKSGTRYPVVYLLHGFGDSETAWYKYGLIQYYVDQNASQTVPMIYVMPEGFNSYWVNKYNGHYPYMDMFVKELVPAIDSIYRTIKESRSRAVMGYSMGGYGAMIMPVKNHNVFKTGVVLSMSFRTDEQYLEEPQSVFDYQWGPVFGGVGATGEQRLTDYFKAYSPFHFTGAPGDTSMKNINLFLDCGDDEETLTVTNDALHDTLRSLGIPHEYRV
ncbi:MAG: alpha/beta hydrolase-fold protein, partial [Bacteroidota bacterium]|nr:alpha/beta hydrolase-fold protein [Bacteroidota bacterium]